MIVKFKKLKEEAVIPSYAKDGDAGKDLVATSRRWNDEMQCWIYGTGLAVEIPKGHVGLLFPRSSVRKYGLILTNSVGVIDSGYRGEIMITFRPAMAGGAHVYDVGDRVAQLIIMPYPEYESIEVKELSETERGEGGHGSTGK
jgi:dUTP pyrophosphatase